MELEAHTIVRKMAGSPDQWRHGWSPLVAGRWVVLKSLLGAYYEF